MPRPTSIEIDLAALRHNASQLKRIAAPRQFFAVVKADAYGHGAIECSRALETIADGLVAERDEFVALFSTEDQQEGTNAFLEKREPEWKNR